MAMAHNLMAVTVGGCLPSNRRLFGWLTYATAVAVWLVDFRNSRCYQALWEYA
jgi:hypothetical protein